MAMPIGAPEVPHIEVDEETREVIKEMLSQMERPVEVKFFKTSHCGSKDTNWCVPTEELLDLLSSLAPQGMLRVEKYGDDDAEAFSKYGVDPQRVPTILLADGNIRYLGAPLGEEVRAFIETLVRLSNGKTGLRQRTRTELAALAQNSGRRVHVITFVTPACPYCPYAVLLANMFAHESGGKVTSVVVESFENPDLADMYGVAGVPTVVLQAEGTAVGEIEFVGVPPEHDLLARVKHHMGLA